MTRFSHITRHYSEAKVAKLRPRYQNTYVGNEMSLKLYDILRGHQKNGTNTRTFGILDPVQLIEAAPYLETVYVSGWTCSSTASVTHEPGPDDASYPNNTVPNKVLQFSKAQEFHDRKQNVDGGDVDYYRPIIADADTGFGGIPSVMKHVKLQIEAGAAGVHIEDQKMPGIGGSSTGGYHETQSRDHRKMRCRGGRVDFLRHRPTRQGVHRRDVWR
jgi:isocitrate lyase